MYLFFQAPLVLGLLKNHGNINLNVRIIIPYYNWFEIFIFPLTIVKKPFNYNINYKNKNTPIDDTIKFDGKIMCN